MTINNFFETKATNNLREGGFENLRFEALKVKKKKNLKHLRFDFVYCFQILIKLSWLVSLFTGYLNVQSFCLLFEIAVLNFFITFWETQNSI